MGQRDEQSTGGNPPSPRPTKSVSMTEAVRGLDAVEPSALVDVLGVGPEECILCLVREHDGKLPQERIVELLPWSAATVSRLLSDIEDQQQIVRLHAGRGKVVFLTEQGSSP